MDCSKVFRKTDILATYELSEKVCEIAKGLNPDYVIPKSLEKAEDVVPDPRWDEQMAREYATRNHRESYLFKNRAFKAIWNFAGVFFGKR